MLRRSLQTFLQFDSNIFSLNVHVCYVYKQYYYYFWKWRKREHNVNDWWYTYSYLILDKWHFDLLIIYNIAIIFRKIIIMPCIFGMYQENNSLYIYFTYIDVYREMHKIFPNGKIWRICKSQCNFHVFATVLKFMPCNAQHV